MSQNCNLVSEFNGLVSKRVNQQDWPFLLLYISSFIHPFLFFISTIDLINLFQGFIFFENYFLLKQDADVYENLTLFL